MEFQIDYRERERRSGCQSEMLRELPHCLGTERSYKKDASEPFIGLCREESLKHPETSEWLLAKTG